MEPALALMVTLADDFVPDFTQQQDGHPEADELSADELRVISLNSSTGLSAEGLAAGQAPHRLQ